MTDQQPLSRIVEALKGGPKSITEIAIAASMDWRTANEYLKILADIGLVKEKPIRQTRTFYYQEPKAYFKLYVKPEHREKINAFYQAIRESCKEQFKTEPTKTQVYKILWKINTQLKLGLPIGLYQFGPCCVQVYTGNEKGTGLSTEETRLVQQWTNTYCAFDNSTLQKKIYEEEKWELYLLKEKLLAPDHSKETLNNIFMAMIKVVPDDVAEVFTDYIRATLSLGWEMTGPLFSLIWKFITTIIFKNSLQDYYGDALDVYMDDSILTTKHEAQISIIEMVQNHSGQRTGTKSQST